MQRRGIAAAGGVDVSVLAVTKTFLKTTGIGDTAFAFFFLAVWYVCRIGDPMPSADNDRSAR